MAELSVWLEIKNLESGREYFFADDDGQEIFDLLSEFYDPDPDGGEEVEEIVLEEAIKMHPVPWKSENTAV